MAVVLLQAGQEDAIVRVPEPRSNRPDRHRRRWARQLTLALLGTVVQFGWEKALGDDAELGWWCDRAAEGLAAL
ncbi:MAG: hypothetical protein H6518_01935 [Microthrixaceae bacterium]|nr:hypothetical protein [Microthrixaceae bacterium]